MRVDLQEKITLKSTAESMCQPIIKPQHISTVHNVYLCHLLLVLKSNSANLIFLKMNLNWHFLHQMPSKIVCGYIRFWYDVSSKPCTHKFSCRWSLCYYKDIYTALNTFACRPNILIFIFQQWICCEVFSLLFP